jgi:hypothetical protein
MTSSSDRNSPPLPSGAANGRRRSSFTGQFVDLFGSRSGSTTGTSGTQAHPGPITSAAAQAQQRRLSLTTVGLSGSPNQSSPFTPGVRPRAGSISGSSSGTVDESPFEEGDAPSSSVPTTPFGRRLSFGARAMRDMRSGSGNGNGNGNTRSSASKAHKKPPPPPPTASYGRGLSSFTMLPSPPLSSIPSYNQNEPSPLTRDCYSAAGSSGFDFAENMRIRAERSSISATSGPPRSPPMHQRSKSMATMEAPAREMPKQPKVPDAIQERILRGDFYMD